MSHTITITRVAGDQWDDADYTIAGDCDWRCEVWTPCEKAWHRHPKNEYGELIEWSTKSVPIEHQFIDNEWMVPSGRCALRVAGTLNEAADDVSEPGTYDVEVHWDDCWWFTLSPVRTSDGSGS
jgi:hypothetical protein